MKIDITPPQQHEIITALHKNRSKIQQRINHNQRLADTPEELEKQAIDPTRKIYLDAMEACRKSRIATIDGLLAILEAQETKNTTE